MNGRLNISGFNSVISDFGRSQAMKTAAPRAGTGKRAFHKVNTIKYNNEKRKSCKLPALALLGCCTACFCAAFLFEALGAERENEVRSVMKNLLHDERQEDDETEKLGKLKLVELPSIIEVFTHGSRPSLPAGTNDAALDKDGLIAKIYAEAGTEISSVLPGTVKAVNPSSERGGLVIVSYKNDIEIYYYGLSEISVERGQPVLQGSSLGVLGSDVLYLKITKGGKPIDPFEFLGMRAEVG